MNQTAKNFRRSEDGGATVESVLWFVFFIFLFGLVVDVAMIFNGQARALRVVQDWNRQYSVGQVATVELLRTGIDTELRALSINPSSVQAESVAGVVSTKVQIPASQLALIGYFTNFAGLQVDVAADMIIENWET